MPSNNIFKLLGIVIVAFSSLSFTNSRAAEIDSFTVGLVTGSYLGATDLMIKVAESDCRKFIKKKYNFEATKNEILANLNEQDQKELTILLNGDGMRLKRQENFNLIGSYLKKVKAEGLSNDFVCGTIIGIASTLYDGSMKDWYKLKEGIDQNKQSANKSTTNKATSKYCDLYGNMVLNSSFYSKNELFQKELYKLEIIYGKWSSNYRKASKILETRDEQFKQRDQLIEKLCEIKDTNSSEYLDVKLKINALEEVLEMHE